jgi:hypothetical protein
MTRYFGRRHKRYMHRDISKNPEALKRLVLGTVWSRSMGFNDRHHWYLIMTRKIRGYWFKHQWYVDPKSYLWENSDSGPIPEWYEPVIVRRRQRAKSSNPSP